MADYIKYEEEQKGDGPSQPPKPRYVVKRKKRFNWRLFFILIISFFLISSVISSITYSLTPKIATVSVSGVIASERSTSIYGDTLSSREISNILESLETDDSVKGVVIDINSPGGSPVASEEISNAIISLKEKKPVYCVVTDVGASGGYWVGVACDKLYASKLSIVGSIGVTSAGLGFENLIKDYNITYRRQVAGDYKDIGTPFREPTKEENEMLQNVLDEMHLEFMKHISNNRNISLEELEPLAQGQIYLGNEAKQLNLIDEIGTYNEVLEIIQQDTNTTSALIVNFDPEPTLAEVFGVNSFFELPSTQSQIMLK